MRTHLAFPLLLAFVLPSILPLAALWGAPAPAAAAATAAPSATQSADEGYWVEPMKKVHASFTGKKGTFAHFGDSITVSMAFWGSLYWDHKNLSDDANAAFQRVSKHMLPDCWNKWKGPKFGNEGSMTIRWADENIQNWLKDLNPEAALIMFGTNDVGALKLDEYETKLRRVIQKCLDNGTIVILSTIPPKAGRDATVKEFVAVIRKVAQDLKVPLCDYYDAVLKRRPDDWNGTAFKDAKDVYDVPTLISRDGVHPSNPKKWQGDYSEEGLKNNGFVLRNYVTLMAYDQVVRRVLQPQ